MNVGTARIGRDRGLVVAVALAALAGCAPLPAPSSGGPPPGAPARPAPAPGQAPSTTATRREPARTAAAVDSMTSPEAERVLATIPEPLGPAQQVPPDPRSRAGISRDTSSVGRAVPAPEAAYDTLRVERASDDGADIPVPAPTPAMGAAPPVTFAAPESTASRPASGAPAAAAPPPAAALPPATPPAAHTGDCWRLQVAAPAERDKADSRLAAAQSLLLVPMVIEREKGLFKVRTRDCLGRDAADALKKRAIESGFAGSFVLKGSSAR